MAYNFGATRLNRLTSASVLNSADPRPLTCGFRLKQNSINDRAGFGISQWIFEHVISSTGDPNFGIAIRTSGSNNIVSLLTNAAYSSSAAYVPDTTSYHGYAVSLGTGSPGALAFYRDGATITGGTTTATFGGTALAAVSTIGALANVGGTDPANDATYDANAGFTIDGSLGEFCLWNVVLDAAEAQAFTAGVSGLLIRPSALRCYMPFNNDAVQDLYRGAVWTAQGTNTKQADHPRISLPDRPDHHARDGRNRRRHDHPRQRQSGGRGC